MSNRKITEKHFEASRRRELAQQLVQERKNLNHELSCITNEEKIVLGDIETKERHLFLEHSNGIHKKPVEHRKLGKAASYHGSGNSLLKTIREHSQFDPPRMITTADGHKSEQNNHEVGRARRNKSSNLSRSEKRGGRKSLNNLAKEKKSRSNDEIQVGVKYQSNNGHDNTENSKYKPHDDKRSPALEDLEVTSNCSVESNPASSEQSLSSSDGDLCCRNFPTLKKGFLVTRQSISVQEATHKDDLYDPVKEWHKRLEKTVGYSSTPGDSSPTTVRRVLTKHLSCPLPYPHKFPQHKHNGKGSLSNNHFSCLPCEAHKDMITLRDISKSSTNSSPENENSYVLENSELRKCRYLRFPKYVQTYPEDLIDLKECSKFVKFYHKEHKES